MRQYIPPISVNFNQTIQCHIHKRELFCHIPVMKVMQEQNKTCLAPYNNQSYSHLSEKCKLPAHTAILCHSDKATVTAPHFLLSHTEEQKAIF
jgi:hypothetical protein